MHLFMFFDSKARVADPSAGLADARTEVMRQAFCRRDHATVDILRQQGAAFTQEMLHIAVGFPDHRLTALCLDNGVRPDEEIVRRAVDLRDAELVEKLVRHLPPAQNDAARAAMFAYIRERGGDDMAKSAKSFPPPSP
jgi:hypothetical protein